ncbi:hypothetical protein PoB_007456100 [Plakobranchus ocellatus]|uniref:Uncharacterized protein n=1 Tax=Plakobranchus ocellatus TaxID=259542 RepID=A0AAV4DVW9_9GAST|nr:hypothetical protein PoB_007456100 [Plakobranchus ocellatus]
MVISKKSSIPKCNLVRKSEKFKQVTKINYLDYLITSDGRCTSEIKKKNSHGQRYVPNNEANAGKQKHKYGNQTAEPYYPTYHLKCCGFYRWVEPSLKVTGESTLNMCGGFFMQTWMSQSLTAGEPTLPPHRPALVTQSHGPQGIH